MDTPNCPTLNVVRALSQANLQYTVLTEEDLAKSTSPILLIDSLQSFTDSQRKIIEQLKSSRHTQVFATTDAKWLAAVQAGLTNPSLAVAAPVTVRAVIHDQAGKTVVHLLNLNIQKISSFQDHIIPAADVRLTVRVAGHPTSVQGFTADPDATQGVISFTGKADGTDTVLEIPIKQLSISTILLIQ
jgi:hypothetical protein